MCVLPRGDHATSQASAPRDTVAGAELSVHTALIAMTQRSRERVRSIRRRCAIQLQYRHHHVLNLFLGRGSCAYNRLLDFTRRVLEHLNVVLKRGTQRRRARVTQFQGTAGVLVHEDALDRHNIGSELRDDATNGLEDLAQPVREATIQAFDGATGDIGRGVALEIEDAEPGQA